MLRSVAHWANNDLVIDKKEKNKHRENKNDEQLKN